MLQGHEARQSNFNDSDFSLLRMLEPEVLANPYAIYRTLREHDPVHWDPYMHAWVVTTYRASVEVLTKYSADRTPSLDYLEALGLTMMKPFAEVMKKQMMFMDSPQHTKLRLLCASAFTPRKVEALKDTVRNVAETLIDKFADTGRCNLIADFANPLPAIVTAKLMGVPEEDHAQLHAWVLDIAEVLGNFQHHPNRIAQIITSLNDLCSYVREQMRIQEKRPNGGLINSLMSAEVDGNRLTEDEIVANTIITLIGGHETTTNLIASGFLTLTRSPEAMELLRNDPAIMTSAVEELLRYEAPVQHTARIAPEDALLEGKLIKKNSRVVVVLAAANRDPIRFPDPDRLDLLRTDNRHLSFGWAAHFCFGAPLARLEAHIAFRILLEKLKRPTVTNKNLVWRENAGLRGLMSLDVAFEV